MSTWLAQCRCQLMQLLATSTTWRPKRLSINQATSSLCPHLITKRQSIAYMISTHVSKYLCRRICGYSFSAETRFLDAALLNWKPVGNTPKHRTVASQITVTPCFVKRSPRQSLQKRVDGRGSLSVVFGVTLVLLQARLSDKTLETVFFVQPLGPKLFRYGHYFVLLQFFR